MSRNLWAQLVKQVDSPELNLLPGVPVMHLSQHTLVSLPTISPIIAFCCSCCSVAEIKVRIFHSITEDNKHVFPSLNEPSRILAQETDVRLREFIKTDSIIKRMVLILEMQSWTMYNHKKNGLDLSRTRTHDMHKIH